MRSCACWRTTSWALPETTLTTLPPYLRAFDEIVKDSNQLLVVVASDNEPVGTLQLTIIPGLARRGAFRGQIEAVRVHADHRGSGLGARPDAVGDHRVAAARVRTRAAHVRHLPSGRAPLLRTPRFRPEPHGIQAQALSNTTHTASQSPFCPLRTQRHSSHLLHDQTRTSTHANHSELIALRQAMRGANGPFAPFR